MFAEQLPCTVSWWCKSFLCVHLSPPHHRDNWTLDTADTWRTLAMCKLWLQDCKYSMCSAGHGHHFLWRQMSVLTEDTGICVRPWVICVGVRAQAETSQAPLHCHSSMFPFIRILKCAKRFTHITCAMKHKICTITFTNFWSRSYCSFNVKDEAGLRTDLVKSAPEIETEEEFKLFHQLITETVSSPWAKWRGQVSCSSPNKELCLHHLLLTLFYSQGNLFHDYVTHCRYLFYSTCQMLVNLGYTNNIRMPWMQFNIIKVHSVLVWFSYGKIGLILECFEVEIFFLYVRRHLSQKLSNNIPSCHKAKIQKPNMWEDNIRGN